MPGATYGRYFEDLEVGQEFRHWPGRTITAFDNMLSSLMCMNQHPVHIDEHFSKGTQHKQPLVEGPLIISIMIGLSQTDVGGQALAVLEYADIEHLVPVFHGDTIYAESTILKKEELPDQSDRGVICSEIRAINQRGETVVKLRRTIVVPKRTRENDVRE